jgi:GxxExxY protein
MNTDLSERVIGAIFEVANTLGAGFLEKVYGRPLVKELRLRGIRAEAQAPMDVSYKGESVGSYFADIVVKDELVAGTEMCGSAGSRAYGAMSELPAGLGAGCLFAGEFSESEG